MKFRCSSIGKLMTEAQSIDMALRTPEVEEVIAKKKRTDEEKALIASLKNKTLSETAKTYIRELAMQDILGVDFEVSSKPMQKGIIVEPDSIALLNSVRGLSLVKNTERRENDFITGECDLYDAERKRGHDIKSSWSAQTFPGWVVDCEDKIYEWQCRGYMALWDADEWEVNWCLVDTPENLVAYEPMQLHLVSHIPERLRVTSWVIKRDMEKEQAIFEKVAHAMSYMKQVINEFEQIHKGNE